MRYVSPEQSIAAAGAALAYVEDESLLLHKAKPTTGWLKRTLWRAMLVTGLIVV